ncbi:MAG: hypothetical protein M3Q65_14640 [Chloroflexota bacterium]|nr:hypothetical protein [Chloroflexota bacterium]
MLDWLDRILLSPSRESVDQVGMALAAVTLIVVALILISLTLSLGRPPAGPDGGDA